MKNLSGKTDHVTLGINIAVGMGLCTFVGIQADKRQGGGLFWTLLGTFIGLFYCGYELWKLIRQSKNDDKN